MSQHAACSTLLLRRCGWRAPRALPRRRTSCVSPCAEHALIRAVERVDEFHTVSISAKQDGAVVPLDDVVIVRLKMQEVSESDFSLCVSALLLVSVASDY